MRKALINVWTGILFLIAVEQGIKIDIYNNFLHAKIPLIEPFLYFKPIFNRDYSWFNSMLQIGGSKWFHIILTVVMIAAIVLVYRYIKEKAGVNGFSNTLFAFLLAAAACSLLDRIFWNGSLDYIQLTGWFTFDLKDLYVNTFVVMLLAALIFKNKTIRELSGKHLGRGFIRYILRKP